MRSRARSFTSDLLAGLTVAAVALPLDVQVSGPAAALSVMVLALSKDFGVTGVAAATIYIGLFALALALAGRDLVAEAKGQYPTAIGRALAGLKQKPALFKAYNELCDLSLVRPHRTVTFRGFAEGELRAVDAAMVVPPTETSANGSAAQLPPLPAQADGLLERSA